MKTIVTRIAPSPTGMMHIGTARTALFNYLYAKHMGGKFLLRIEDTDKDRSTSEAVQVILDGLKWLGLDYDGDVVFQSDRSDRHIAVAHDLLARGAAYKCYLTSDEAAAIKVRGKSFRSPYRDPDYTYVGDAPYVIRFKVPLDTDATVINDLVKGQISFDNENLDDLVLLRSDGSPTYNLAVVVDDHDMGVNVVCRGDDHVSNTPRQILIYKAMGWDVPEFGHIPLIFTENGKKYSKRDGAAAITDWRDAGYLPATMRNYLTRLGWGHGDAEIFSDAEAIEWFDLKDVVSAPARFNIKKLNHINNHYIRTADVDLLVSHVLPIFESRGIVLSSEQIADLHNIVPLIRDGASNIPEIVDLCAFVYSPVEGEVKAVAILSDPIALDRLRWVQGLLAAYVDGWVVDDLNHLIHDTASEVGIKMKDIGPVLRAAITGSTNAPDLGTCLVMIGKNESIARINKILQR